MSWILNQVFGPDSPGEFVSPTNAQAQALSQRFRISSPGTVKNLPRWFLRLPVVRSTLESKKTGYVRSTGDRLGGREKAKQANLCDHMKSKTETPTNFTLVGTE